MVRERRKEWSEEKEREPRRRLRTRSWSSLVAVSWVSLFWRFVRARTILVFSASNSTVSIRELRDLLEVFFKGRRCTGLEESKLVLVEGRVREAGEGGKGLRLQEERPAVS